MSNLSAFFAQNAVKKTSEKYMASDRFVGEDGVPIEWELTPLTAAEDEALRNKYMVEKENKMGVSVPKMDVGGYQAALVAKCVKWPNLNNAELQDSYGVCGAEELLLAMLDPGEYMKLVSRVQKLNGLDIKLSDLVDQAKN